MEVTFNIAINKILTAAARRRASHIHFTVGAYPVLRIDDNLVELQDEPIITSSFLKQLADAWLLPEQKKELEEKRAILFFKAVDKNFRLRVNFFYQKSFLSVSLRVIPSQIPSLAGLGLPKNVSALVEKKSGLIVIAGPYGSGRTTTVAALIEEINKARKENIVTVEQPIEYLLTNKQSLIEQREVGRDALTFTDALKYAQRTDVNVLVVDANSEVEATSLILEFANSGRLVIAIMDTTSVISTIEEILVRFPPNEKNRAQSLLAEGLLVIIAQRLVPRVGGGLVLAAEILTANESVRSLIRDGKIQQLATVIQSSRAEGMSSLDQSLAELVKTGDVLVDQAIEFADNVETFRSMIRG